MVKIRQIRVGRGCLAIAEQALRANNLLVLRGSTWPITWSWVGGNEAVTLTIVCVSRPGSVWVVISASSDNVTIAAQARDVVRGMIESAPIA